MTKHLKHIAFVLLLIILSSIALACTPDDDGPKNATFYDNVEQYAYESYLKENVTKFPLDGSDLPLDIVQVIRTQSELESAIPDGHIDVDFNTEVIVLYLFTDIYMGYDCRLKSIGIEESQLRIVIFHELAEKTHGVIPPCTSYPTQRCMAIKTTLIDFDNATITIVYPS